MRQLTMNVVDMPLTLFAVLMLAFVGIEGSQQSPGAEKSELGDVNFPISCAVDLQQQFSRGVALLHSFWYDRARKVFLDMENRDPQCAMAYWGEAMSLYPQLSGPPGETTLKKGRVSLEKAIAIGAKTQRERDYISALSVFYGDFEKGNSEARVAAYVAAMEQLQSRYTDDHEAAAFYALALIAASPRDNRGAANRQKATSILEKLFAAEPNHPGVAHYLIHIYDRSEGATLGLRPATRYAAIAPGSPHALHMPSHIFNRLGMWQESINSNLAAVAATQTMEMGIAYRMHPMDFLDYAYLQIGRDDKAAALLDELKGLADQDPAATKYMMAVVPARHALELHNWKAAAGLEIRPGLDSWSREMVYWAQTIGAARSGNLTVARDAFKELSEIPAVLKSKDPQYNEETDFYIQEAASWVAHAEGNDVRALELMRTAANRQDIQDAGQVTIPAREMLADLLLETGSPERALTEYELALQTTPKRFNSVYGAAVAAHRVGNTQKAAKYARDLLNLCADGKYSSRPELAHLRSLERNR
jgi:hypothetical protein